MLGQALSCYHSLLVVSNKRRFWDIKTKRTAVARSSVFRHLIQCVSQLLKIQRCPTPSHTWKSLKSPKRNDTQPCWRPETRDCRQKNRKGFRLESHRILHLKRLVNSTKI